MKLTLKSIDQAYQHSLVAGILMAKKGDTWYGAEQFQLSANHIKTHQVADVKTGRNFLVPTININTYRPDLRRLGVKDLLLQLIEDAYREFVLVIYDQEKNTQHSWKTVDQLIDRLEPGDPVVYLGTQQRGIVVSVAEPFAQVVYNCDCDWDNYDHYTAQRTDTNDLTYGWHAVTHPAHRNQVEEHINELTEQQAKDYAVRMHRKAQEQLDYWLKELDTREVALKAIMA